MALADDEIEFVEVNGTRKKFADTTAREAVDTLGETVEEIDKRTTFHNQNSERIESRCTNIDSKFANARVIGVKYNGWAYLTIMVDNFSQPKTPVNYNILKLPSDYECGGTGEWLAMPGLYYDNDTVVGIAGRIQVIQNGWVKMQESNELNGVALRLMLEYPLANP